MLRLVTSLFLITGLLLAAPAYAEENSTDSGRTNVEKRIQSLEKINETRSAALERRKAALAEFETKRKEALEDWKTRREEFKEKLAEIKDERKQKILENLDTRIEKVNDKWVTHWNNVLTRLTEIVAKVDEKSDLDTAAAKAAIASAQTAVNTQAGKTYEIEVEEEETLGENVKATLGEFHEDLREVQTAIKLAREEVGKVLRALKNEEN